MQADYKPPCPQPRASSLGGIIAYQVINFNPLFLHGNKNAVEHPPPPLPVASYLPNGGTMEVGTLGKGDLRRWCFLASCHGARICTSNLSAFLLRAVAASLSLRSFSLRQAPLRLCTRTSPAPNALRP